MEFLEIEHKFLIEPGPEAERILAKVRDLNPASTTQVEVTDTYFTTSTKPHVVLRHRYDREIQQLTLKSYGQDTEVRQEINLDLGHHKGAQLARAEAFCQALGFDWRGALHKSVTAFYFDDCEVVYYRAEACEHVKHCLELEAVRPANTQAGLAVLHSYETKLGLSASSRCQESLFDLMFPEQAAELNQQADH